MLGAFVVAAFATGQAAHAEIVGAPIDLSAFVHEGLLPGPTIFEDTHSVTGAFTTPKESAEYLYLASKGENLSGRSTAIDGAFSSALAEFDGNGGVGVTSWIGGSPSTSNPAAVEQLAAQATWDQSFTYNGTVPATISLRLKIPAIEVGLIGVPPDVESPTATETAEAIATLAAIVTHPDSTISPGTSFEFGLRTFERQLTLGPGVFENFADVGFIGASPSTVPLFDSFKDNGDQFNPRFSLDSVSVNLKLGTLEPGDTVSYVYRLTADGTTHGSEQGFMAFLGDPFGGDVVTGNLLMSISPEVVVPEPATWMLVVIGFGFVIGFAGLRVPTLEFGTTQLE